MVPDAAELALQAVVRRGVGFVDAALSAAVVARISAELASCIPGFTADCAGACYPSDWVGDGICDAGADQPWGSPDFACPLHGEDGGDC